MNFTEEQLDAINKSGTNIIVSAGAGSGKTAVLTERVLRILKEGTHINELLVLTFTNAAAAEMKKRIRDEILKYPNLVNELDLIDSSYITTFDSFALSIVKKYHYLLNISLNVKIIDESLINIKKNNLIDEILEEYYKNKNSKFINLINTFCTKDDDNIKEAIIDISNKLDLIIDKESYIDNYINNYFNEEKINNDLKEYELLILNKVNKINDLLYELSLELDTSYMEKINEALLNLMNSKTYEEVRNNLEIKLPNLPKGTSEYSKKIKKEINDSIIKELKELTSLSIEELKTNYLSTKEYIEIILEIIKELDKKIREFKYNHDVYEFNDIAKLSIKIVNENENIRKELKETFKEILIDEYQDTSDIQESFINLIENNNVYMVGDIKQSIYRFRNANPYIFKDKYDLYSDNIDGYKIDMNKNFRSREEVIKNINNIFNVIMTDKDGGANYIKSHNMSSENNDYKKYKVNQNYNLEILEYIDNKEYKKEEIEAFIIINDIETKIKNKYQVYDKKIKNLRDITYNDFVILMDRSTDFDLYKEIFTYKNIPLVEIKDSKMNEEIDLYLIKNIIKLIYKVKDNVIDQEYKYLFTSIARSFLFSIDDNIIYETIINNKYNETDVIKIVKEIINNIDNMTISNLINEILIKYNYYEKLITINNIESSIIRIDKLKEYASSLEELGYSPLDYSNYLDELINSKFELKYSLDDNSDGVRIMTIHKSKGLEFPICYYSGLYKDMNNDILKKRFLYDNRYGIITPYFKEGIGSTFYKTLMKEYYLNEEVSEKIRLFYVALTRAKEQMIMITPYEEKIITKYSNLLDIINKVKDINKDYYKEIDINNIDISKNYKLFKNKNINNIIPTNNIKIIEKSINIDKQMLKENKYSKVQNKIIDKKTKFNIENGLKIHEEFELDDFKNPKSNYVKKFIKHFDIEKSINIIKEYEFIYEDNEEYHGIIDLLIEYDTYIDLIDYKLKNINDDAYLKQLNGYKKYIEKISNKKVNIYLYSVLDDKLDKIEELVNS